MAMDWLKGLVGPVAQFSPGGQPMQGPPGGAPGYPQQYGAPPMGGAPPVGGAPPAGGWGPPPGWDPNAAPAAPPVGGAQPAYGAGMPGVDQNAFGAAYGGQSAYGAPQYGAPQQYGAPAQAQGQAPVAAGADPRVSQLENRVEELKRDLESMALFAQALLAVLEDRKVMTQQDFQEMRRKLDLMDGRLDDRIGKAP